jgi:hypothetical protein
MKEPGLLRVPALLHALIHWSAWKVNSRNCTSAEFREVPHCFLGTSGVRNSRKPGFWYRRGILRSEAGAPAHDLEEDYMAEETRFWGVVLPRWPAGLLPQDTGFITWPEFVPNGKPVHHYPLFSSKEKAEEFVHERLTVRNQQIMEATLMNIRRICRHEIPDDHYVSLDGGGLVTWGDLL